VVKFVIAPQVETYKLGSKDKISEVENRYLLDYT